MFVQVKLCLFHLIFVNLFKRAIPKTFQTNAICVSVEWVCERERARASEIEREYECEQHWYGPVFQ